MKNEIVDVEIGDGELTVVDPSQYCPRCEKLRIACECGLDSQTQDGKEAWDADPRYAMERGLWEEKVEELQDKLAAKNIECERWREAYEKARGELGEQAQQLKQEAETMGERVEAHGDRIENKLLKLELEITRLTRERDQAQRWWDKMLEIAKLSWHEADELKKLIIGELQSTKSKEPTEGLYWALSQVRTWAVNAESTRYARSPCSKVIEIADAAMAKARELGFKPMESKHEDDARPIDGVFDDLYNE